MKNWKIHICIVFLGFIFQRCCFCDNQTSFDTPEKPLFTFAVAGHAYGNPDTYTHSLYPAFLKKIKADHLEFNFDFLFLTGDVIWDTVASTWTYTQNQLDSLEIPWYIAPGNHDMVIKNDPLMTNHKQFDLKYFSDNRNGFVVLNTCQAGWTLSPHDQITLQELSSGFDTLENIFVFTHQLWWERNPRNEFKLDSLRPNSFEFYDGETDFWKDAFPAFERTSANIYFFAGDMGAWSVLPSYYEDHYRRYHFFGSGMGGGVLDNYLVVSVFQNGTVNIQKRKF